MIDIELVIQAAKLTPQNLAPNEYIARYLEAAVREAVRQVNAGSERPPQSRE